MNCFVYLRPNLFIIYIVNDLEWKWNARQSEYHMIYSNNNKRKKTKTKTRKKIASNIKFPRLLRYRSQASFSFEIIKDFCFAKIFTIIFFSFFFFFYRFLFVSFVLSFHFHYLGPLFAIAIHIQAEYLFTHFLFLYYFVGLTSRSTVLYPVISSFNSWFIYLTIYLCAKEESE